MNNLKGNKTTQLTELLNSLYCKIQPVSLVNNTYIMVPEHGRLSMLVQGIKDAQRAMERA